MSSCKLYDIAYLRFLSKATLHYPASINAWPLQVRLLIQGLLDQPYKSVEIDHAHWVNLLLQEGLLATREKHVY